MGYLPPYWQWAKARVSRWDKGKGEKNSMPMNKNHNERKIRIPVNVVQE